MNKNKIRVCGVLPCTGELDIVTAEVEDETGVRHLQICIPKYCEISKCIGEEIWYEVKNGRVRISSVHKPEDVAGAFLPEGADEAE